ncbi:MAG: hypothetical protein H7Z37_02575, partial [Pyrinomonadaceae bacterium]|nr:hypothetical protein [Pyrinomonadaceae bacterium]
QVTDSDILSRLNLLNARATVSESVLRQSADNIQSYLRGRGFYKAEVNYSQQPSERENRSNITFNVVPNAQAEVENFTVTIRGFDATKIQKKLRLKKGETFSNRRLELDVERIRRELIGEKFLAPNLSEPQPVYDSTTNTINITLNGNVGAKVTVKITDEKDEEIKVGETKQRTLLPVKREGTLDASAIVEGAKRLQNNFQQDGYFFADVQTICSVSPQSVDEANTFRNNTATACDFLSSSNSSDKEILINYQATLNRRFKLSEIRVEGTSEFTSADISSVLGTQVANALGVIPVIGLGRGFTSQGILDEDKITVQSLMRELGYRKAVVNVRQGISPDGENLIITFVVKENARTYVSAVDITGNTEFGENQLRGELPEIIGRPFSRARIRTGNNNILSLYAKNGFIDARSNSSIIELPSSNPNQENIKVVYNVEREGVKTFINRILPIGNEDTRTASILETIPLRTGEVLRTDQITEGERNLYATDAFRQIDTQTEPAGTNPDGTALRDVFINVQEQQSRVLNVGVGVSTDDGPNGTFNIRNINLMGRLYQGGARIRASRFQQIVQLDFINPRFISDGERKFAPLTLSAQYSRDTGVTRFFRSTLDRGTFGVVQRLDESGNPIDQFGESTGAPSINRLSFTAETSRTVSRKTGPGRRAPAAPPQRGRRSLRATA